MPKLYKAVRSYPHPSDVEIVDGELVNKAQKP